MSTYRISSKRPWEALPKQYLSLLWLTSLNRMIKVIEKLPSVASNCVRLHVLNEFGRIAGRRSALAIEPALRSLLLCRPGCGDRYDPPH
jgi:hypothetical protein